MIAGLQNAGCAGLCNGSSCVNILSTDSGVNLNYITRRCAAEPAVHGGPAAASLCAAPGGNSRHGLRPAGCAVLRCSVLCCAVLCCAVLCCAVLCCAVLCCVACAVHCAMLAMLHSAQAPSLCSKRCLLLQLDFSRGGVWAEVPHPAAHQRCRQPAARRGAGEGRRPVLRILQRRGKRIGRLPGAVAGGSAKCQAQMAAGMAAVDMHVKRSALCAAAWRRRPAAQGPQGHWLRRPAPHPVPSAPHQLCPLRANPLSQDETRKAIDAEDRLTSTCEGGACACTAASTRRAGAGSTALRQRTALRQPAPAACCSPAPRPRLAPVTPPPLLHLSTGVLVGMAVMATSLVLFTL